MDSYSMFFLVGIMTWNMKKLNDFIKLQCFYSIFYLLYIYYLLINFDFTFSIGFKKSKKDEIDGRWNKFNLRKFKKKGDQNDQNER